MMAVETNRPPGASGGGDVAFIGNGLEARVIGVASQVSVLETRLEVLLPTLATKEDLVKLETRFDTVLPTLASKVDVQAGLAALRQEMNEGTAVLRKEMNEGNVELRKEMNEGNAELRREMSVGAAELRKEMSEGIAELRKEMSEGIAELRQEMSAGFASLRKEMSGTLRWAVSTAIVLFGLFMTYGLHFLRVEASRPVITTMQPTSALELEPESLEASDIETAGGGLG